MNAALGPLPERERWRALALIGVDRWVLRSRAMAEAPPDRTIAQPARIVLAIDAGASAGAAPLSGRHAALLAHVLAALRLAPQAVAWSADGCTPSTPLLCLGEPRDAALVAPCRAPALEQVRASAAAKRELWRALKPLARRLRSGS